MGVLFGTDGVRGVANLELTPEIAFNLGKAGAYVLTKGKKENVNILIGKDTRISCDMLESALVAGMCSVGANAILVGVVPTPAVAYLIKKHKMDAGVVISASHNTATDNGIKFFSKDGYKLPDEIENGIEDIMNQENFDYPVPTDKIGRLKLNKDGVKDYTDYILSIFKDMNLKGLKVAIDCANGATHEAAPIIMKKLSASTHVLHSTPNGLNINDNCGSTHMESLCQYVKENKMDIGIAFDGDGDRCLVVDENGEMVDGDQMMAIFSKYLKENNKLNNNTLVTTVMSNLGLFIMCEENGIKVEKTAVGDRYVLERMIEIDGGLGGEQSGHVIFLDHNTTGDGILTAVQMLKIMHESKKTLGELKQAMKLFPQILINAKVSNDKKYDFDKIDEINNEIKRIEEKYHGRGRALIRASGTEPLVRVMIEGEDLEDIELEAKNLSKLIEKLMA